MNVIISNKQQSVVEGLNIDVIKNLNGEYTVDDIIATFKNFFYQRMILDITAIKDYKDIKNLQKLSISLDMEKLILLLEVEEDSETSTPQFLSKLISMGIYNFTKNSEGLMYLYNTPNSYRDVAQYQQLEQQAVTVEHTYSVGNRIIGVKNLTEQAGATSLIYMMLKNLSKNYDVVAVEVGGNDFKYFSNPKMFSVKTPELGNFLLQNSNKDVILIDVKNDPIAIGMVKEMIFLVEPSIIKLNKMLQINPKSLVDAANHKIVLNKSMLSSKDISELQYEVKTQFVDSISYLNDRESHVSNLDPFLNKIGFTKQEASETKEKKKWGFF